MAITTQGMTPLIQVYDMQQSLQFYCDILGFQLVDKAGPADDTGWAMIKLNEVYMMLNTQYEKKDRPETPDRDRFMAHSDTCMYFMCADAAEIYEEITRKGIVADEPKVVPYGMKQLYFLDPDGYNICFQSKV